MQAVLFLGGISTPGSGVPLGVLISKSVRHPAQRCSGGAHRPHLPRPAPPGAHQRAQQRGAVPNWVWSGHQVKHGKQGYDSTRAAAYSSLAWAVAWAVAWPWTSSWARPARLTGRSAAAAPYCATSDKHK